jgi:hypothetical protein
MFSIPLEKWNKIVYLPLAKTMVRSHQSEFNCDKLVIEDSQPTRSLIKWARLLHDLLCRGFFHGSSLKLPQQVAYEIHREEVTDVQNIEIIEMDEQYQMVSKIFIRNILESASGTQNIALDARLLKAFVASCFHNNYKEGLDTQRVLNFQKYAPPLASGDKRIPTIRSNLTANFVRRSNKNDSELRTYILDGYCSKTAMGLKFLADKQKEESNLIVASTEFSMNLVKTACIDRFSQLLDENITKQSLSSFDASENELVGFSVIEISICIHENKIDRSFVTCPITPILYPFFIALDAYLTILQRSSGDAPNPDNINTMRATFESRDRLWRFSKHSHFISDSSFLGFDESGFLLQWTWFRKRFEALSQSLSSKAKSTINAKRNVELIMGTIDRAVHIESGDVRLSAACWKKIGHPLVPAKAKDSISSIDLRSTAINISLYCEEYFGYQQLLSGRSANISMTSLFEEQHTALISTCSIKSEALTALSMAHWTTTDEIGAAVRMKNKKYDVCEVRKMLSQKLNLLGEEFIQKVRASTVKN